MLEIKIEESTIKKEKPKDESNLGFGKIFTDHMFLMDYDEGKGWHDARIVPYGPLSLDPSTAVFHYAQEIFEGLKAYRTKKGINLFRPDCNAERFQNSADRMSMPKIATDNFIQACKALVKVEKDWVPSHEGTTLYLRPFMIATSKGLGVHASKSYEFIIIASPSGAYYASGLKPTKIYVEDELIRSAPGLTGFAKCGGNYGASIRSGEYAQEIGYDQVLWLDGVYHEYVEEVGSMNIFFKIDGIFYTSPCVGTVLPGVTRRSVITLLKEMGYQVREEKFSIDEVMKAGKEGRLEEVFGTGTAAVISPVGVLRRKETVIEINRGEIGPVSQQLYDTLTDIQWGRINKHKEWTVSID
jgi:branched-chain amino acid aminotransferase